MTRNDPVVAPVDDDELALFRATVARFVATEMVPNDAAWRRQQHVGPEIWRRAGELGLLCADVPAEYGGMGASFLHEAIVHEELARSGMSGFGAGVHTICAHYLLNTLPPFSSATQSSRYRLQIIGQILSESSF